MCVKTITTLDVVGVFINSFNYLFSMEFLSWFRHSYATTCIATAKFWLVALDDDSFLWKSLQNLYHNSTLAPIPLFIKNNLHVIYMYLSFWRKHFREKRWRILDWIYATKTILVCHWQTKLLFVFSTWILVTFQTLHILLPLNNWQNMLIQFYVLYCVRIILISNILKHIKNTLLTVFSNTSIYFDSMQLCPVSFKKCCIICF